MNNSRNNNSMNQSRVCNKKKQLKTCTKRRSCLSSLPLCWTLVSLFCLLHCAAAQGNYYTLSRGSGIRNRMHGSDNPVIDTLQRGHEGLLVQLKNLNDAIKEDELKLNNVFYKLGRHDTDIQASTAMHGTLKNTARKLEAKLNKQAYNMDFLRRHVLELQRGVKSGSSTSSTVTVLQTTVNNLQKQLARAVYRTEQLEDKTKHLEEKQTNRQDLTHYSPNGLDDNNIYYASRTPKTTYYYIGEDANVCDESSGWISSPDGGCWLISKMEEQEVAIFPEAVASCARKHGELAEPETGENPWPKVVNNIINENKDQSYWTSGTSAFTPGDWTFLFTGATIAPHHWKTGQQPNTTHDAASAGTVAEKKRCASYTNSGLVPVACTQQLPYICKKV